MKFYHLIYEQQWKKCENKKQNDYGFQHRLEFG